jgi:hypothetical protein
MTGDDAICLNKLRTFQVKPGAQRQFALAETEALSRCFDVSARYKIYTSHCGSWITLPARIATRNRPDPAAMFSTEISEYG